MILWDKLTAETIGLKQFSGVGGQVDFIRGATMAKDGKSIIAMPSTAAKEKFLELYQYLMKEQRLQHLEMMFIM